MRTYPWRGSDEARTWMALSVQGAETVYIVECDGRKMVLKEVV